MPAYTDIPLAQLTDWLSDARAAQHALLTGAAVVSVASRAGQTVQTVQYAQAQLGALRAYVAELEAEIAAREGGAARHAPIRLAF